MSTMVNLSVLYCFDQLSVWMHGFSQSWKKRLDYQAESSISFMAHCYYLQNRHSWELLESIFMHEVVRMVKGFKVATGPRITTSFFRIVMKLTQSTRSLGLSGNQSAYISSCKS
ncbi:unnamed protein product [Albugo candida]|uniref:Uncharacterized protein n=1 Tax=Albugo candida TaxID=65357 RepID=A0A024G8B1_9STRA|nr:unnamed protein product [Albugo candida]|eukprot:CCI43116.1 unnamed protein product [Albugo candida]